MLDPLTSIKMKVTATGVGKKTSLQKMHNDATGSRPSQRRKFRVLRELLAGLCEFTRLAL